MPYKISSRGRQVELSLDDFTDNQIKALRFYRKHDDGKYHSSREVAIANNKPNGQFYRGVTSSLHHKGLLIKIRE